MLLPTRASFTFAPIEGKSPRLHRAPGNGLSRATYAVIFFGREGELEAPLIDTRHAERRVLSRVEGSGFLAFFVANETRMNPRTRQSSPRGRSGIQTTRS